MPPPRNRDGFRLAVVCALPEERRAVEHVMEHYNKPSYGKADGDKNFYLYGELGGQPIVLTTQADKGPIAATETARMIQSSFRRIELVFLVGITGGAPFRADGSQTGVRLGDVIVSQSMRQHDFGKQMENTFATATAFPSEGGELVKRWVASVQGGGRAWDMLEKRTNNGRERHPTLDTIKHPTEGKLIYEYPGRTYDRIYPADQYHKHHDSQACQRAQQSALLRMVHTGQTLRATGENVICDENNTCMWASEDSCRDLKCQPANCPTGQSRDEIKIFLGHYVSGAGVMKSAQRRDELVRMFGALAIEMEGPGVWGTYPTIVVKGVVDYADSHKNKVWRDYPAANAALCTEAIIEDMDFSIVSATSGVFDEIKEMQTLLEQARHQSRQSAATAAISRASLLQTGTLHDSAGATLTASLYGLLMIFMPWGLSSMLTALNEFDSSVAFIEDVDRRTAAELTKEHEVLIDMKQRLELQERKHALLLEKIRDQEPTRNQRAARLALFSAQGTIAGGQRAATVHETSQIYSRTRYPVSEIQQEKDEQLIHLSEALKAEKAKIIEKEDEIIKLKAEVEDQIKRSVRERDDVQTAKANAETQSMWQTVWDLLAKLKFW